jgi:hypothetical protein
MNKINEIKNIIRKHMDKNDNMFNIIMDEIDNNTDNKIIHTMFELKQKFNKKLKGDLFEAFCYLYIKNIMNHDEVWFYCNFPIEKKQEFHLTLNDMGIDLISKKVMTIMHFSVSIRKKRKKFRQFHGNHYQHFMHLS